MSPLLERGFVRREAGDLVFDTATVGSALPTSVRSLLAARVDCLASADRALLQAAAVIGRRFDPDLLKVVPATGAISTPRSPPCKRSILSIAKTRPPTTCSSTRWCATRSIAVCSTLHGLRCTLRSLTRSSDGAPIVFPKSRRRSRTTMRPLRARTRLSFISDGSQEVPGHPFFGRGGPLCSAGVGSIRINPGLRRQFSRCRCHG